MVNNSKLSRVFIALAASVFAVPVLADGKSAFTTDLSGYQETPLTLNSAGSGEFAAKVSKDGTSIAYRLTYRDLGTAVTQAHIHFGRPGLTGMIVLFLCTNLTPPAVVPTPQTCPASPASPASATVTGSLIAADVIARPDQGIEGGAAGFAEIVKALRAGAAYANVHTTLRPSGEIRGGLGTIHDDSEDDND